MATAEKQLSQQEATKQIKAIYQDFLNKINKIKQVRNEKVTAIIKKAEQKQIEDLRRNFK